MQGKGNLGRYPFVFVLIYFSFDCGLKAFNFENLYCKKATGKGMKMKRKGENANLVSYENKTA